MDTTNNIVPEHKEDATTKATVHAKGNKMIFAILAYLGILVVIPLIVKKDDPFVKFHIKQGLVLLAISLIIWLVSGVLSGYNSPLWMVYRVLNLGVVVLSIVGIVNVVQNKMQELPLVGHLSSYFPI